MPQQIGRLAFSGRNPEFLFTFPKISFWRYNNWCEYSLLSLKFDSQKIAI